MRSATGRVIASPWLRLAFDPPWWKLWPGAAGDALATGVCPADGDASGAVVARSGAPRFVPDLDLVHHGISARMYFAVRTAGERVLAEAAAMRTPLLLLHGDDDPVTSHHATCEFFEHAGAADKTLRIYPGVAPRNA